MESSEAIPQNMKAWTFSRRGKPIDVLKLSTIPVPLKLEPTDVLVKVSHAALNPFGYTMIWLIPGMMRIKPSIPEFDFSGRIVMVGAEAGHSIGDDVFGTIDPPSGIKLGHGSLCEYLVINRNKVVYKPKNASFEVASGLAVAGVTSALVLEKSGLKQGDSVLVNGGSGGVGLTLVQMAKEIVGVNGKVVVTCSAENGDLVKSVGADEIIDYRTLDVPAYLATKYKGAFSAIIDAVGQSLQLYNRSPAYLMQGKPFLCIGTHLGNSLTIGNVLRTIFMQLQNTMWPRVLGGTPRPWIFVNGEEGGLKGLEKVKSIYEDGKLDMKVDSVYEMEDALKAYNRIMSRRAIGKVIVKVQDL